MGDRLTFAEVLGNAVHDRGVSLRWLQRRLVELGNPVSLTTLSYWRSGERVPERRTSLDALRALEELLLLPEGKLAASIGAPRRPGPPVPVLPVEVLMSPPDAIAAAFDSIGVKPDEDFAEHHAHVVAEFGPDGYPTSYAVRTVWQALRDNASRVPVLLTVTQPGRVEPDFLDLGGGTLGARHIDHQHGVYAYELVLDRPTAKGQEAVTEYTLRPPPDHSDDLSMSHSSTRRLAELLLWLRFHPDKRPSRAEVYTTRDGRTETADVDGADGATILHHALIGFGPGTAGVRWWW